MRLRALVLITALAWASPEAAGAVDPGPGVAPRMEFTPPRPGTYELQKIQPVGDATLLDPAGRPTRLSAVTTGKATLLTFFYTYCADPLGCPLAYQTLVDVRGRLLREAAFARKVRFVSVSLDPTTDTPEVIGRYRQMVSRDAPFEWDVLTARSVRELMPVLDDFGQDVSIERASDGTPRRTVHHMLKVFLIDRRGTIREIYSLAYLQPEVIANDIRTLLLEEDATTSDAGRVAPGS